MNAIIINLALAVFWLFLAGGIFALEWTQGPLPWRPLDISAGWIALLLSAFNGVRVTTIWMYQKQRRQMVSESELLRQQFGRHEPRRPEQPPDPNFQFTEPPPESESKGP